jgi:ABC-type transport system involved in multi-copper enzyme maturation permease subunit
MAMGRIAAIAGLTFRQALREKVLYLLIAAGAIFILVSVAISLLTVGDEVKIIKDLGLASVALTGALVALLVGAGCVALEVERRTLLILFSKPVARWEVVVGKFLGVLALALTNVVVLTLLLEIVIWWRTGALQPQLLTAAALSAVEVVLLTAFAVLFSCFSSQMVSGIFGLGIYLIGHFADGLSLLQEKVSGSASLGVRLLILLLPNLERFNVRAEVVHRLALPGAQVALAVGYGLSYAGFVLLVTILLFRRRNFT